MSKDSRGERVLHCKKKEAVTKVAITRPIYTFSLQLC